MSVALARAEMHRFLRSPSPEILVVTGLWGVGKTYAWNEEIKEYRNVSPIPHIRYSYVSAFGIASSKEIRDSIFQSTVRLDSKNIEPSVESLRDNIANIKGAKQIAEWIGRNVTKGSSLVSSLIPGSGAVSELILPAASLLIRNQIICIDDLERFGSPQNIGEVLGFACQMRDQRNCKVAILLNHEMLGEHRNLYDNYLEKIADQAVIFKPSTSESIGIALKNDSGVDKELSVFVARLGITNVRVIKKIRKFLSHLEPHFPNWHHSTITQAIQSLALFGWVIFEPRSAPCLDDIRSFNQFSGIFDTVDVVDDGISRPVSQLLQSYGFSGVDDFDEVLIEGIASGFFDLVRLNEEAEKLNSSNQNSDARTLIEKPWTIYSGGFGDDSQKIEEAIIFAIENVTNFIRPSELNAYYQLLIDLKRQPAADDILEKYLEAQDAKPRSFFSPTSHPSFFRQAHPNVRAAFEARLERKPLEQDPIQILLGIDTNGGWNNDDIEFLASLTSENISEIFRSTEGESHRSLLRASIRFVDGGDGPASYQQFGAKVRQALESISEESEINAMRVRSYIDRQT